MQRVYADPMIVISLTENGHDGAGISEDSPHFFCLLRPNP